MNLLRRSLPAILHGGLLLVACIGLSAVACAGLSAIPRSGALFGGGSLEPLSALAAAPTPTGATAAGALGGSFRFRRSLDVSGAGWAQVVLTPVLWGLMTEDGHDLRLFGPDGSEVPYWRTTGTTPTLSAATPKAAEVEVEEGPVTAKVVDVSEVTDGWLVTVDLGADRRLHNRLWFEFSNHQVAAAIGVEASDDRAAWQGLANANLFRLGEGGLQQTSVTYPTSNARFLRLHWPRSAGFPEVQIVYASLVPGKVIETVAKPQPETTTLVLTVDALPSGPDTSNFRLGLPGQSAHLKAITFGWGGVGTVAYRLLKPGNGRWVTVAEGTTSIDAVAPLTGTQAARIAPSGLPAAVGESTLWLAPEMTQGTSVLRLELTAGGTMSAHLAYALAEVEPEWLLFFAPTPGRYTLAYGAAGLAAPNYPRPPTVPWTGAVPVSFGPEETQALPPLPANVIAPGAELPPNLFKATWSIEADETYETEADRMVAIEPGSWVRLNLPETLYGVSRPDFGDVRLLAGGHQVPYLLRSDPEPIQVLDVTLQPSRMTAPQDVRDTSGPPLTPSTIAVDLPAALLPLTALELSTAASPFTRPVRLRYVRVSTAALATRDPLGEPDWYPDPGLPREPDSWDAGSLEWVCSGVAALPCRLTVPLDANPTTRLVIEFDDGDNAPLSRVRVQVWRRNAAVEFAWPGPGGTGVQLVAGAAELGPPRYDLQALGESLRQRPALAVNIENAPPEPAPAPSPPRLDLPSGQERWLLIGALILAAAVLLLLLSRTMRAHD